MCAGQWLPWTVCSQLSGRSFNALQMLLMIMR